MKISSLLVLVVVVVAVSGVTGKLVNSGRYQSTGEVEEERPSWNFNYFRDDVEALSRVQFLRLREVSVQGEDVEALEGTDIDLGLIDWEWGDARNTTITCYYEYTRRHYCGRGCDYCKDDTDTRDCSCHCSYQCDGGTTPETENCYHETYCTCFYREPYDCELTTYRVSAEVDEDTPWSGFHFDLGQVIIKENTHTDLDITLEDYTFQHETANALILEASVLLGDDNDNPGDKLDYDNTSYVAVGLNYYLTDVEAEASQSSASFIARHQPVFPVPVTRSPFTINILYNTTDEHHSFSHSGLFGRITSQDNPFAAANSLIINTLLLFASLFFLVFI